MENYEPPFHITNTMVSYIASISEKVGRISVSAHLDSKPHLRRNNRIRSIHSSLKIEANSLSLGQVRDVINGHTVLGEQKEIQEVKNAYKAYDSIENINPYSITDLKKYHGIMTKYLVDESGEFRHGEEGVFNGDECIFMAPPAKLVPTLMTDLFKWMRKNKNSVHLLIMSAVFHYEFVFIHPFSDGNGRMARLWHTALLMQWKPIFEYIPIESQIEKFQNDYYDSIAICHKTGNSDVFIEFMLEKIDETLDDVIRQSSDDPEGMSDYVRRLLSVMEYDVSYSAVELMERLGIRSRETFRKNYINPAMDLKLVSMTDPEHRNSRNQRYYKN